MQKGLTLNIFFLLLVMVLSSVVLVLVRPYLNKVGFIPIEVISFSQQVRYEDPELIRTVVSPLVDEGFFSCNVSSIKNSLEALPWIAQADVKRSWPNRLQIKVQERIPIAVWENVGVIDDKGAIFFPPSVKNVVHLPRFTGKLVYLDDMVAVYSMLQKSLQPLDLAVQQLSLMPDQGWEVLLDNDVTLILGQNELAERLQRFVLAYTDRLRAERKDMKVVDLRYTNGLAVG